MISGTNSALLPHPTPIHKVDVVGISCRCEGFNASRLHRERFKIYDKTFLIDIGSDVKSVSDWKDTKKYTPATLVMNKAPMRST